jgi:hypothetical protein
LLIGAIVSSELRLRSKALRARCNGNSNCSAARTNVVLQMVMSTITVV